MHITCHRSHLEARCRERGYSLDEIRACIVSEDGDTITVDINHPAYPRTARTPVGGPGEELKKLLARVGLSAEEPGCQCKSRAAEMDRRGCDWCAANVDTIVGWLAEEAKRRRLPFFNAVGRVMVRRAINTARRHGAV